MAAAHTRRSVATAAVAALVTAIAPFALSVAAPGGVAAAATAPPKMDNTKSVPEPGGAIWGTGENITAVFDQAITGNTGTSSSSTCGDPTKCAFVLYEINADGSRGLRLPGTTSFGTSSSQPVGGTQDTVVFDPQFSLTDGGTYEALVNVQSSDKTATTNLDYKLYVSAAAPSALTAPAVATTGNNKAFPLSGYAPPGMTVSVTVPDPDHPSPLTNVTGSGVVDPCSAISCPWTVNVDISGFSSPHTGQDWTASVQDAAGQPSSPTATDAKAQKPSAAFDIDYSPPAMPTLTSGTPKITNDPVAHTASVTVGATDADADTKSYVVTITDGSGNMINPSFPAQGTNLPSTTIDVSGLDDGSLHVVVQAADAVGNVSAECDSNPPPVQKCSSGDVTKNAGLVASLATSIITSASGDTTFTNAQTQAVQTPTKITVGFTQTIKESFMDCCTSSGPVTNHSSLCIATANGNCIANGGTPTVASDSRSISFPISTKLTDGKYEVTVHTYSQSNCPDRTPQGYAANGGKAPDCESYNDFVRVPNTGTPATPFQFTVSSTTPTVTIGSVTNPITTSNEHGVAAFGAVSKTASTVQVLYTSSGKSPTKLLANASITQPSDPNATLATWSAGPSDLSSLPDGPVTVKVTAKSASGLQGTATKTIQMQAHITTLSEFTDHSVVTANHAIHITGHLSDESGDPIANASISVRPRFSNGKLGHAATAVTNSSGAYSATFVPTMNAKYLASYAGSPAHDSAHANAARTNVRAAVSLHGKASQGRPVAVGGAVSPNKSGKTVTIFKKTSSGWVVAGKARLNGKSRFTVKLSLARGKNRLYAAIGQTSGNLAGKSGVLVINVH
jgi:hypothetical protein